MPRASPIYNNWNAGELSPALAGRVDFEKYKNGAALLENVIPLVQGPAERRPGTHFAASIANEAQKTWLVPFDFSQTQSYVLEMGDLYIRFFWQRAQLLNFGTPYAIGSPWGSSDLTNADGTFALTSAQSNDYLFFAHPKFFPQQLIRAAHTSWSITGYGLGATPGLRAYQYAFQYPFRTQNQDTGKTLYASNHTGIVTLTAALGFIFEPWMVGCLMLIEQSNGSPVPPWEPAKAVAVNQQRRSDARVYFTSAGGTTGSVKPVHTDGSKLDGQPGVSWQYIHSGYGVVQITAVADAAHATATVISTLPDEVTGIPANATYRWSVMAWNTHDGYPNLVGFFRERLYWVRGNTFWFSAPADFFNYAERDLNGDVTADQAITVTLSSDTADPVRWARETPQGLLVGTDGGEWLINEAVPTDPLGPGNIRAVPQSAYGSRALAPVKVQHSVLFMQRGGRKLREAIWGIDTESVKSRDLTVLANHITQTGITSMAFQQEPRQTMWLTRNDGLLLSFTYNSEQDVYGWHRHPVGSGAAGDAAVESVCVIPSPDGGQDDLYMIVARTLHGVTRRFVEWLDPGFQDGDDIASAWYLDSAQGYSGAPVTVLSGLDHLIGESVSVLADGSVHRDVLVDGTGSITLDRAVGQAVVGLRQRVRMQLLPIEAGAADGTAQGKTTRIQRMHLRFINTVGCKAGPSFDELDDVGFRDATMPMDLPIPPFTGDKEIPWPGDYAERGVVCLEQGDPLPFTLAAVMPQLNTQDS